MRKIMLILALVVMLVHLSAAAALAYHQLIQCKSVPCYGSGGDDKILERKGNGLYDKIIMRGGYDLVQANGYGNDTDVVKGGTGYDKINVADGDKLDTASGGAGRDWCIVDARKETTASCARVTVR
ncbi:MAG TPA: hypothetical protein VFY59_03225 [Rubrobacter sp.]|nr:hypothetical protein [Rubrobacter sp.]